MKINEEQLYERVVSLANDDYHIGFMVIIAAMIATIVIMVIFAVFYNCGCSDSSRVHDKNASSGSSDALNDNDL